jgi:hypothetical protein
MLSFISSFHLTLIRSVQAQSPPTSQVVDRNLGSTPQPLSLLSNYQQYFAILIVLAIIIFSLTYIVWMVRKTIEATGRNPLATKKITFNLLVGSLVAIVVTGISLLIAYLMFTGNPPPPKDLLVPTPTPPMPSIAPVSTHTTNCFTVSLPYKTSYSNLEVKDHSCTLTTTMEEPKGSFTLTLDNLPPHSFFDNPSLTMRRKYPDKYTESPFSHPFFNDAIIFSTSDEIVLFAQFPDSRQLTFAFHQLQPNYPDTITPSILGAIINTIIFPDDPQGQTLKISSSSASVETASPSANP